jgi:hypothetical protein
MPVLQAPMPYSYGTVLDNSIYRADDQVLVNTLVRAYVTVSFTTGLSDAPKDVLEAVTTR